MSKEDLMNRLNTDQKFGKENEIIGKNSNVNGKMNRLNIDLLHQKRNDEREWIAGFGKGENQNIVKTEQSEARSPSRLSKAQSRVHFPITGGGILIKGKPNEIAKQVNTEIENKKAKKSEKKKW